MTLSATDVDVTGSGSGNTEIEALATGSIALTQANLTDTDTVQTANLTVTFTAAKKVSITGTMTLASGVQNVGSSVEFTKSIPVGEIEGIESIESITIAGSGSGAAWTVSGITIDGTAES